MRFLIVILALALAGGCSGRSAVAADAASHDSVADPGPNRLDEPRAAGFSLLRAVAFLDAASLTWQKQRKCFACHTNYAYLYACPLADGPSAAHAEVRRLAEQLVAERWQEQGPRWDAEVVATAAALASNDAATTGRLHPLTRQALDRMWTVQRADGGWNWLKCDLPPMESDDHYGATLAAIATGVAPEAYAQTEQARQGLAKVRTYFRSHPPPTLHHAAMLLWANSCLRNLLADTEIQATVDQLWRLQKSDGGWALATLGNWKRADGSAQDTEHSDGYGTGFVVYVLRRTGTPADDPRLQQAIAWLKTNQRESGRWITRSLHADSQHFISHAGTAFAVMALQSCERQPAK
jgi:squalene-hopene/tetraprenyl-beta-curcumene cyclase